MTTVLSDVHEQLELELTPVQLAWLAGLLEGEGSFHMHAKLYPCVTLEMTDFDVVERYRKLVAPQAKLYIRNNNKKYNPKYSTTYRVAVYGATALAIMHRILPYMSNRRVAKIQELMQAFVNGRKERNG